MSAIVAPGVCAGLVRHCVPGGHGPFAVTGRVLALGRLSTGQRAQPAEVLRPTGDPRTPQPGASRPFGTF